MTNNKIIYTTKLVVLIIFIFFSNIIFTSCIYTDKGTQYYNEGLKLFVNTQYNKALKKFELAIINLNKEFNQIKNEPQSEEDKSLYKKEELLNSFFYRGLTFKQIGNFDEAIKDYTTCISLISDCSKAYSERAIAYYNKELISKALSDINIAITYEPKNPNYYYNRANIYLAQKKYDKAIKDLDIAIDLDNIFSVAYYNRGEAYRLSKNYNKAIKDYKISITLFTSNKNLYYAYLNLGKCYYNIFLCEEAEKSYFNAIKYSKNPIMAYLYLGILYGTTNDKRFNNIDKAIKYTKISVELSGYKDEKALVFLASLYYKSNNVKKAYETQEIALKLNPNNKEILEWYEIYKKKSEN